MLIFYFLDIIKKKKREKFLISLVFYEQLIKSSFLFFREAN